MKNEHTSALCPACGSDCNERDELEKAEREINRLRAAPQQAEPVMWAVCDPSGEAIYAALFKTRCVEYMDNEYRYGHSAAKNWTVRPVFLHSTAAPQQAGPVWIRPDQLQKARHAPFLCRVSPTKDAPDLMPMFLHPPAAEVQRLRDALEYLIEKCGDSDDAQYSTLGTKFVRDIARGALEGK